MAKGGIGTDAYLRLIRDYESLPAIVIMCTMNLKVPTGTGFKSHGRQVLVTVSVVYLTMLNLTMLC